MQAKHRTRLPTAVRALAALTLCASCLVSLAVHADCRPAQSKPDSVPPDIRINGSNIESNHSAMVVSASQAIEVEFYPRNLNQRLKLASQFGSILIVNESRQTYQLPANGLPDRHPLVLCAGKFASKISLWKATTNPVAHTYPTAQGAPDPRAYAIPSGLVQVKDAAQAQTQLSEHFQLHQFLPKAVAGKPTRWPQFTLFTLPLLEKLELVVKVLAEHGHPVPTLRILSAYRSPAHNRRVGGSRYSRHQYGDAVDFIVDQDNNGTMDDLNRDGTIDRADLQWLTDRLARQSVPVTPGGEGEYESGGVASAFLHLDARGTMVRWDQ